MYKPLVSIIIPVYNGSNFLAQAIDSAIAQTYQNIEIIVVNDGSCDNGETERIALSYGEKIKYIKKENGGVSSALNVGIREMKGEYFSWLSHDDLYTEEKIAKQIECLNEQDDNTIIVCLSRQINKDGGYLTKAEKVCAAKFGEKIDNKTEIKYLLSSYLFSGCSLLIPKTALVSAGGFDESLRYNQDFDMWLKLCFLGCYWLFNDNVGVLSRVHNQQVTQTRRDLFYKDSRTLGKRIIPQLGDISTKENNFLYMYACNNAKYNLTDNLIDCKKLLKEKKLFNLKKKVKLFFLTVYGKIRPTIRKIYYRLFKKVKTQ